MKRRNFIQKAALSGGAIAAGGPFSYGASNPINYTKHSFNLNYAPHLGMFAYHAGEDPIAQLNFMADHGFTAFEDNGMRNRAVALQEEMAKTMQKRGLTMGVFVAHEIYWKEPNLASGDQEKRKEFLDYIGKAVTVAKRVNAKSSRAVFNRLTSGLRNMQGSRLTIVQNSFRYLSSADSRR